MIDPSSFLQSPQGPRYPPEVRALQGYKSRLMEMRHTLLYEVDLRTIKKADIDMLERDLRDILKGVEGFRKMPHLDKYLRSVDGLQANIRNAKNKLYLASDTLDQRSTIRGRKLFYQQLEECEQCLFSAIQQFIIGP